ncbi:cytochrome P450 2C30-like [Mizuhopecten yessoensis]|uniref:cytochrome P450 2C30-like n=1 Tax=Mizuhopecten yessoensis TaxID=6573 RepID=UPI000B45B826|nr:cytochrome P450 2C30-like [Mizuhopecten yessoensis]
MGSSLLFDNLIAQLCIALILLFTVKRLYIQYVTLPPGPTGYPVIGCLLMLRNVVPSRLYNKLYRKYGPIYSMKMGLKLFVVVSGYQALRDVFIKHAGHFSDRPDMYMFSDVFKRKGIISSSGGFWKRTRTKTSLYSRIDSPNGTLLLFDIIGTTLSAAARN